MVLPEAMACGAVPVTTGVGSYIVRDGVDGFVVPYRDSGAIVNRLMELGTRRDLLRCMSSSAVERAKEFSWEAYERRIQSFIQDNLAMATL